MPGRKYSLSWVLAVVLMLCCGTPVLGQARDSALAGRWVRVQVNDSVLRQGRFAGSHGDTIWLTSEPMPLVTPWPLLLASRFQGRGKATLLTHDAELWISTTQTRYTVPGAFLGLIGGAASVYFIPKAFFSWMCGTSCDPPVEAILAGAGLGAVWGAFLGYNSVGHTGWEPVPPRR